MDTPHPAPWRREPYVAVEFDVLDDSGDPVTLLLSNGGMATVMRTLAGTQFSYYPWLTNLPILIGSTITVTQYGQPVRAQPNGGSIQFRFDTGIWIWTAYHWIGRVFRIYEGERSSPFATIVDVDEDMVLVYTGRVSGFTHDCFTVTIQTTDASLDIDNPLVTDFFDVTFPVGIQGKPRPTTRGQFFSAEPVILNETSQNYEVQSLPQGLWDISEVRVGGVPWDQVVAPPQPGQWSPVNIGGVFQQIQLGSPPAGEDVRVDGLAASYTVGQLITAVVTDAGAEVDAAALAALDVSTQQQLASLVTGTTPVNRLTAIDDFVTAAGCWWGFNPLGQATGAALSAPDPVGLYLLTDVEINTISLNTEQPLAWRIRVGSQRNWQPEQSFDDAVLQSDVAKWSAPGLVYEPHYENPNALTLELRAVDVPLLTGTSPNPVDAANEQARMINAWGVNRTVFDVTAWMRPEDINLYDTVEVDFLMVTGTFRIVSAFRAIGGGPATLQLWGTLGAVPPAPAALPLPPAFVAPPGFVFPGGGAPLASGPPPPPPSPPPPIPTSVTLTPPTDFLTIGSPSATAGQELSVISVTMSDGSAFAGQLSISGGVLSIGIDAAIIILTADVPAANAGSTSTYNVLAMQNGGVAGPAVLTVTVATSGAPPPPPPPPPPTPPPPPPPPPSSQLGWMFDITMTGTSNVQTPWTIQFSDPSRGNVVAYAVQAVPNPDGSFVYRTVTEIIDSLQSDIAANGGPLGLVVVSYFSTVTGTGTGTGNLVIEQSPWLGTTSVYVNPGSPGTITFVPAGPGTGIG